MEVSTTPVMIGTSGMLIQNNGPDDLYVGEITVTTENGLLIKEGEAASVGWSEKPIYVVSEGTSEVRTLLRGLSVTSAILGAEGGGEIDGGEP